MKRRELLKALVLLPLAPLAWLLPKEKAQATWTSDVAEISSEVADMSWWNNNIDTQQPRALDLEWLHRAYAECMLDDLMEHARHVEAHRIFQTLTRPS